MKLRQNRVHKEKNGGNGNTLSYGQANEHADAYVQGTEFYNVK